SALQTLDLGRRCARLLSKVEDWKRFLMLAATKDVPRFQQLLRQAIRDKCSIGRIVGKVQDALEGIYQARGYTEADADMSLLAYRLGGRKLLYALSHRCVIPSIRRLRTMKIFTQLMPSFGAPKEAEIEFNMAQLVKSRIDTLPVDKVQLFHTGMSIMWDEINEENVACYFPHADCVGGLCREHSQDVNIRLTSLEAAESLAHALADGTVHYGKEASVMAIGSFGTDLRGAFPVLISPTCKKETPQESAVLLEKVLSAWKNVGERHFGPIWTFASDGDAGRRAMVHELFSKHVVKPGHVLYKYLGRLPGFNLCVGDDDVTGTFDWKHELKRMCLILSCRYYGLQVGNTVIKNDTLARHLLRAPDMTEYRVQQIMNPADSQDVPRAIDLIDTVSILPSVSPSELSPLDLQELQIIEVIGETFGAFLDAFIRTDWSLQQQLSSLSKYAHMAIVLFRQNRVSFMPNQLYGDMMKTIHDIYVCIAKQKELD
ncbi:hypothetical protein GLOTRDRAFT_24291, partial [Gloeophyllum trabeum ATCC 11539]